MLRYLRLRESQEFHHNFAWRETHQPGRVVVQDVPLLRRREHRRTLERLHRVVDRLGSAFVATALTIRALRASRRPALEGHWNGKSQAQDLRRDVGA